MFKYHPTDEEGGPEFEVDFTPPFRRVSMVRELEKKLSVTFPHPSEFDTDSRCITEGVSVTVKVFSVQMVEIALLRW